MPLVASWYQQKMEQIHRECEIHREVRAANLEAVRRIVAQDPAMVHLKVPPPPCPPSHTQTIDSWTEAHRGLAAPTACLADGPPVCLAAWLPQGPLERTPLLVAADCCHLDMIRLLLEHGASLADMDRSNANCLHLAVRGQREVSLSPGRQAAKGQAGGG